MPRDDEKRGEGRLSARRTAETHKGGFEKTSLNIPDGAPLFLLKAAGVKRVDIIPYRVGVGNPNADEGSLYFERTFFVHRGIGPNQDDYVCPNKTANKKCPVCEHRARLAKSDDPADAETVKGLAPKERQLFNLIDLGEPDKGVQLLEISFHLFGKQLYKEIKNADADEDYEFFADLQEGLTLKLGIDEKSFGGKTFYEVATVGFKPRAKPYDKSIIKEAYCLDSIVKILSYDELKKIFLQTGDDEDEPAPKKKPPVDDDDPPPKKKRPVEDDDEPAPKKKLKPADDDDWGDEAPKKKPKPVEEDDEPPPKKKPKPVDDEDDPPPRKKPAPVEDDDEPPPRKKKPPVEDDDDPPPPKKKPKPADDDDEEPPPRKKKPPVEDDEEPPPKKKPKPVDDEDEPAPKKKPKDDDDWGDWN